MSIRWWLFKKINRVISRIRGAKGWCHAAYEFNRTGLPACVHYDEVKPKNRLSAWWGAFAFEYRMECDHDWKGYGINEYGGIQYDSIVCMKCGEEK